MVYYPAGKPVRLRNRTCVYCYKAFETGCKRTSDHVIARRFVPTGSLNQNWNLIVNACASCNNSKSLLEDEVSAITMQPDSLGKYAEMDPRLAEDGVRKGRGSIHRDTGVPVEASHGAMAFEVSLVKGCTASFQFTAPPQLPDERAFELAALQMRAFAYAVTYDQVDRKGGWLGTCYCVASTHRADWGNALLNSFQQSISEWEHRLHGVTADGYFKVMIRRAPRSVPLWAWAIEWNANYRIIGFLGEPGAAQECIGALSPLEETHIMVAPNQTITYRLEIQLAPDNDHLFDEPRGAQPNNGDPA